MSGRVALRRSAAADRTRWDLLLGCVAILILTGVARLHLVLPVLGIIRPMLVFGGLAIILYLLDVHPARRLVMLRSPVTMWLLALTLWMAVTVPTALRAGNSFTFLVDDFLKTVVLFALVVGAVRGPRDVRRIALVYFAGAVFYAAVVLLRFEVGGGSWRLEQLYTYDPNDFATFAVTAMPLGLYFLTHPHGRVGRIAALVGCIALAVAFVWAGSRGGFLAFLGVIGFMLLRYHAVPLRWRVLGGGITALTVLAAASERYWAEMGTLLNPSGDYNLTSPTGRLMVWQRGIGYMLDHPVFGVGAMNFPAAEGVLSPLAWVQDYGIGVRWTAAHNSLLQVGAELGIPGLVLLLGLVVATFRTLRTLELRPRPVPADGDDPRPLAQALTGSLVGFLIGAFFLSLAYSSMLYTLAAVVIALRKVTPAAEGSGARQPAARRRGGRLRLPAPVSAGRANPLVPGP